MNLPGPTRSLHSLLFLMATLVAAPVHANSQNSATGETQAFKDRILQTLAEHPDDPALQERGGRLLQALQSWDEQLQSSEQSPGSSGRNPDRLVGDQATGKNGPLPQPGPLPTPLAGLDPWNLEENHLSVGVTELDWTIDRNRYPGTKLALSGQYTFLRGQARSEAADCDCPPPPLPHRLVGTIGFDLMVGDGDLEYSSVSLSGITYQRNWLPEPGRLDPIRDTLEWGVLSFGHNDYLGIDSYTELTVARAGRTWGWRRNDSAWMFTTGVGLSGGWAWAESVNPQYRDVSNPFAGTWIALGLAHPRWGKLQAE